jgi:hypothetical protein
MAIKADRYHFSGNQDEKAKRTETDLCHLAFSNKPLLLFYLFFFFLLPLSQRYWPLLLTLLRVSAE